MPEATAGVGSVGLLTEIGPHWPQRSMLENGRHGSNSGATGDGDVRARRFPGGRVPPQWDYPGDAIVFSRPLLPSTPCVDFIGLAPGNNKNSKLLPFRPMATRPTARSFSLLPAWVRIGLIVRPCPSFHRSPSMKRSLGAKTLILPHADLDRGIVRQTTQAQRNDGGLGGHLLERSALRGRLAPQGHLQLRQLDRAAGLHRERAVPGPGEAGRLFRARRAAAIPTSSPPRA